jgi:DtxR family manganese transport transcriptional regulator
MKEMPRGRRATALSQDAGSQATDHARTRQAHRRELVEDYVEIIAHLIDKVGEARVVDIARRLGVSHVTVSKTIDRLQRDGLVTSRPYRSIFLTDSGRSKAAAVRQRHEMVVRFLRTIGVSEAAARADAEGIEHHVSEETLAAFTRIAERDSRAARGASAPSAARRKRPARRRHA